MGAMFGLLANGNMQPQHKRILGKTKRMTKQATKMVEDVTKGVTKMMKR